MLTVILKGTNSCNLDCSYCSLGKKNHATIIEKEMLYNIMEYSCELCRHNSHKEICFILHGGEPTLIKSKDYDYAIGKIRKKYTDLKIKISMQTNGYRITDEWIDFCIRNDVNVGVSIDGSSAIHDKERNNIQGEGTFEIVQINIDKLLEAGVHVSCLMVLTSYALKEGFEFLKYYEEKGLHLKINPLLDYGEVYDHPELSLQSGQYAEYLIRLYEYCLKNEVDVTISPIDRIVQGILSDNRRIRTCSFNKRCNEDFVCIDYKGDIYPCGRFSDLGEFCIGNIDQHDYGIFEKPTIKKLLDRRNKLLPTKCKQCKYLELCHAGCNAEAYISGSLQCETALCKDYFTLFDYFKGKGLILLKEELIRYKENLMAGVVNNEI